MAQREAADEDEVLQLVALQGHRSILSERWLAAAGDQRDCRQKQPEMAARRLQSAG